MRYGRSSDQLARRSIFPRAILAIAACFALASIVAFVERTKVAKLYYWVCAEHFHACGAPTADAASTSQATYAREMPARSDDLVDSIGVDTHFNYPGSPYDSRWPAVSRALVASGIRHIRDGAPSLAAYGTRLTVLGRRGITHSIGFGIDATQSDVTRALREQAPYVDFVESANEFDATKNSDWPSEIGAAQDALYAAVRSSPADAAIAVLGPSMAQPIDFTRLGNVDASSDAGNLHHYMCNDNPGTSKYDGIPAVFALARTSTSKPLWTTETGYNDDAFDRCAIPDRLIAKYDPRMVAEDYVAGVPRTYFYELADEPPVTGAGELDGLVDRFGRPKPQFTALASMIALLSDRGKPFEPKPLSYRMSGSTQNVHHLLLQKRDGTYVLMLWIETSGWAPHAGDIGGDPIAIARQAIVVHTSVAKKAIDFAFDGSWHLRKTGALATGKTFALSIDDTISFLTLE